ncbi:hypothetical protein BT69DRAFT_280842 [Atractiella rhizophila]|nr:hypothetical protein BT69DRAFT_280842 [Atractiella rhizophila]
MKLVRATSRNDRLKRRAVERQQPMCCRSITRLSCREMTVWCERSEQLCKVGLKPDGILLSAGGGGLLGGVLICFRLASRCACISNGTAPVAAIERSGATSLHDCLLASYVNHNEPTPKLVSLEAITSIASSFGAKTVEDASVVDMTERFAGSSSYLPCFIPHTDP